MVDLDKALQSTVKKMVKEQVNIKQAHVKRMVQAEIKSKVKDMVEISMNNYHHLVKDEVSKQISKVLDEYIRFARGNVRKLICEEIRRTAAKKFPDAESCGHSTFRACETWTPQEDLQLRDEVVGMVDKIARRHERSSLAIFYRIRDKIFNENC